MVLLLLMGYLSVVTFLALMGFHRLWLLALSFKARRRGTASGQDLERRRSWPALSVHIPLYNEPSVAARIVEAAGRLEYPGPLEIMLLDDSNDETSQILEKTTNDLKRTSAPNLTWRILRRQHRQGFKAGALAEAMKATQAELIAIFDADFVPPPDFLLRTVPALLDDPRCGMVQARWGHLNRNASWLTRAQAVLLDGHFVVEQLARATAGRWFNFNGTAGVWRRSAIEDAGGWRDATLTEDLDLSYRAQLSGWRFRYLHHVVSPAELPERWSSFRSQQGRWVKGSMETARLLFLAVARKKGLPLAIRLDALAHLLQNVAYIGMTVLAALLPATVLFRAQTAGGGGVAGMAGPAVGNTTVVGAAIAGASLSPAGGVLHTWLDILTLTGGAITMFLFYGTAALRSHRMSEATDRKENLRWTSGVEILAALCIGAGMSVSNSVQAIRGLRLIRTDFVRTPKSGGWAVASSTRTDTTSEPERPRIKRIWFLELAFAVYFGSAVVLAAQQRWFQPIPFLLLYLVGFTTVGLGSLVEARRTATPAPTPAPIDRRAPDREQRKRPRSATSGEQERT